jgi:hypothetical protein
MDRGNARFTVNASAGVVPRFSGALPGVNGRQTDAAMTADMAKRVVKQDS